ncbi:D-isomer specific 2-hydroxyacid dehydrogenase family protein [Clostridium sp. SHJSY1]|uniref:D-isomer specific 2-hydroxyacid dehydrogenase family protein n=1 Tax=Clostridium sp. SHJSY1 TaxID=2942483 RepID=UPI00287611A0|nr:D-isomer specific 2-hydroxyacid dehydrogenase family protein [Clostridium sp. SHJSY1]MDS0526162.1 D-isomer specific 2-hydroxyacid dehydrogenase family protein [Clostridium sp. SHJSY1]
MKILAYSNRPDETEYFKEFGKKYNVQIELCDEAPSIENASLAKGYDCISVITTKISAELIEEFHKVGVKYISTRTIGYEHIDIIKAKELGIGVGNVSYSPNSVADYTIMLILMATRKIKIIMDKNDIQDYTLQGVQGKELPNLTIGVIGTGRIGQRVINHLSGFGSKLLAYDIYEDEGVKQHAKYVNLNTLLKESDVITLHIPATEGNHHIINRDSIKLMKDGVTIINTARGSLVNTKDLIDGILEKKIGGVALDVIEGEGKLYYRDLRGEIIDNKYLNTLKNFPNVILTHHTAFYTDQAVSDMVENSIKNCILFWQNKKIY